MGNSQANRTDLSALLGDLNVGVFEQQLNTAISDVAANVVTYGKKGELTIKFSFKQIGQSNQVALTHSLKSVVPMSRGRIIEESANDTPLYVGRGGTLTVAPGEQTDMFSKDRESPRDSADSTH